MVHGIEKKFGIIVLTVVFIVLFIGGVFLLWDRSRALERQQELLAETSQLEALIASLQEGVASGSPVSAIEEIDLEQYQTIALENGDLLVGKVVEQDEDGITVDRPMKLNDTNSSKAANGRMRLNRNDVSYLKNLNSNSALIRLLEGSPR